jgi:hypothetical protein
VGGVDGNAEPVELVSVDLVAAAFGQGLDKADDRNAGLEGVISGDKPDIPAADDEKFFGRADEVAVDERLEGAGPVDAGKGVSREGRPSARMPTFWSLKMARAALWSQMRTLGKPRTSLSSLVAMSMPRVPA